MKFSKDFTIKIGNKLQCARISNGYTQEEIAELVGCSPRYISQLESNITIGSLPLIINICKLYHISLDDLYGEYLQISSTLSENINFCGYLSLKDEYKSIVDNNIMYLNKLQNN